MAHQEEFFDTNIVKLRRMFPLLHLWRIPGIAFEWRKLLFSFLGVHLCWIFLWTFDSNYISLSKAFAPRDISSFSTEMWALIAGALFTMWKVGVCFDYEASGNVRPILGSGSIHLLLYLIWSAGGFYLLGLNIHEFSHGRPSRFTQGFTLFKRSFLNYLFLVLSALIISTMISFVSKQVGNYAPLFPLIISAPAVIFMASLLLLLGWIYVNSSILLCSVLADNSDPFDALSRVYSYTINHFGYTVLLIFLSTIVCSCSLWLFSLVISVLVIIIESKLNRPDNSLDYSWLYSLDQLQRVQAELLNYYTLRDFQVRALLPHFEDHSSYYIKLKMLVLAAATSLFWTSSTVIYFLLRLAEDGTPLNEIYQPKPKVTETGVPLVGIAERERAMKAATASTSAVKDEAPVDSPS